MPFGILFVVETTAPAVFTFCNDPITRRNIIV
jgi:hypothetical protein